MNSYSRKLTPEQKLKEALRLYHSAKELKFAAIKKFHPELSDKRIKENGISNHYP